MTNAEVLNFSKENFEAFGTSMNKMRNEIKNLNSELRVGQIKAARQEQEMSELYNLLNLKELERHVRQRQQQRS